MNQNLYSVHSTRWSITARKNYLRTLNLIFNYPYWRHAFVTVSCVSFVDFGTMFSLAFHLVQERPPVLHVLELIDTFIEKLMFRKIVSYTKNDKIFLFQYWQFYVIESQSLKSIGILYLSVPLIFKAFFQPGQLWITENCSSFPSATMP